MALRSAHGTKRKLGDFVAVETLPADELPAGIPAPVAPPDPEPQRKRNGHLVPGPGTSAMGRRGAEAAHHQRQMGRLMGLWKPPDDHEYAPYAKLARQWRDAHMAQLAQNVGGGVIGAGVASIISTAALQLGASRWLHDVGARARNVKAITEASRLADSSRQNLLAAHELAAREAASRPRNPRAPLAQLLAPTTETHGSAGKPDPSPPEAPPGVS